MQKVQRNLFILAASCFILLKIYLIINLYLQGFPLWCDEMLLSKSITLQSFFKTMTFLQEAQTAPPVFVLLSYINTFIFGINEYTLRIIPFLSGVLAVFAFSFQALKMFKTKTAVLAALILFTFNTPSIYYSAEFKQYSSDILICILLILSYGFLTFKNLNAKRTFLYAAAAFFSVLSSFPALFIIPFIIFLKCLEEKNSPKQLFFIFFGIFAAGLYILFLFHLRFEASNLDVWRNISERYFLKLSFHSFYDVFSNFFDYNNLKAVSGLILCTLGAAAFLFEKNRQALLMILIIMASCVLSILNICPSAERVWLYLTPIFIILAAKAVELPIFRCSKILKTLKTIVIAGFLLFSVKSYNVFNFDNINKNFPYDSRKEIKNACITFLDNRKEGEFITMDYFFYEFSRFYNISEKRNLKLDEKFIDFKEIYESEEFLKHLDEFIEQHKNDNFWIAYSLNWILYGKVPPETIERMLKERNLEYIKKDSSTEDIRLYFVSRDIKTAGIIRSHTR